MYHVLTLVALSPEQYKSDCTAYNIKFFFQFQSKEADVGQYAGTASKTEERQSD